MMTNQHICNTQLRRVVARIYFQETSFISFIAHLPKYHQPFISDFTFKCLTFKS